MDDSQEDALIEHALHRLHELEVARAQHDLASSAKRVSAKSGLPSGLLVVTMLLILVAVAAQGRSAPAEHSGAAAASAPTAASHAAFRTPGTPAASTLAAPTAPNPSRSGIADASPAMFPSEVGGQPVLNGPEAIARASAGSDQPFLAAGWVVFIAADCASECPSGYLLRLAGDPKPNDTTSLILAVDASSDIVLPVGRPAVLQVHSDLVGQTCGANCSRRVVVTAVLWVGGR